jgi:hypothetical protein
MYSMNDTQNIHTIIVLLNSHQNGSFHCVYRSNDVQNYVRNITPNPLKDIFDERMVVNSLIG